MAWAIDLRVHSLTGLPETEPLVAIEVTSPSDPQCSWASAAVTSVNGTSFIGAWTSVIVRGGNELQIRMSEKNPIIKCASGGPLSASATLNLEECAAASAADGGSGTEMTLALDTSAAGQRFTKALDDALTGTASAAEKIGGAVDSAAEAAQKATGNVAPSTTSTDTPSTIDVEAAIENTKEDQIEGHLYSVGDLRLRITIKVIPVDRWEAQNGSFELNGGALEQPVAVLPPPLHSYAHGGFMGLATTVLADPEWSTILKEESDVAWKALQREQK